MQIYHGLTPLYNKHGLPNKNFKIFNSISLRKWKIYFFTSYPVYAYEPRLITTISTYVNKYNKYDI